MRENFARDESPDCTKVEEKASIDREAFLSKGGEEKGMRREGKGRRRGRRGRRRNPTRLRGLAFTKEKGLVWSFFMALVFLFVFASVRRV